MRRPTMFEQSFTRSKKSEAETKLLTKLQILDVLDKRNNIKQTRLHTETALSSEILSRLLVQCFVITRLDYCNSLLYDIQEESINKHRRVQNAAVKLMFGLNQFDHVSQLLKDLHWLPIRYRIQYKISLITFKTLRGDGPDYLLELLAPSQNGKSKQSACKNTLKVPKSK